MDNYLDDPRRDVLGDLVPRWMTDGALVNADLLSDLTREYGIATAYAVDELSHPCPVCSRNTYGESGTVCEECDVAASHGMTATGLELAGAYSPRCDY